MMSNASNTSMRTLESSPTNNIINTSNNTNTPPPDGVAAVTIAVSAAADNNKTKNNSDLGSAQSTSPRGYAKRSYFHPRRRPSQSPSAAAGGGGGGYSPTNLSLTPSHATTRDVNNSIYSVTVPLTADTTRDDDELQIETAAYWVVQWMLWIWYVLLIVSGVLVVFDWQLQWTCHHACGTHRACSDTLDFYEWVEPQECPQDVVVNELNGTRVIVTNTTVSNDVLLDPLKRFLHLFWTIPSPNNSSAHVSDMMFTVRIQYADVTLMDDVQKFRATLVCSPGSGFCNAVIITVNPLATISTVSIENTFDLLANVTNPFYNATLKNEVGLVYQQPKYTITSMVLRYVLFVFALYYTCGFVASFGGSIWPSHIMRRWSIEQLWIFIMQVSLLLYLNPIILLCVYAERGAHVDGSTRGFLQFVEHHLALLFFYVVQAFILVLTCSMQAAPKKLSPKTHTACFVWLLSMCTLDVVSVATTTSWDWTMTPSTYVLVYNIASSSSTIVIYSLFIVLEGIWFLLAFFASFRVYRNLARMDYLETRRQQLVFRLFIFFMTAYVLYVGAQTLIFITRQSHAALLSYQRDQQCQELVIAFVFVWIMTYCYSSAHNNAFEDTPYQPRDHRWKLTRWPLEWYLWLQTHGGSVYFFSTEDEAEAFYKLQHGDEDDEHQPAADPDSPAALDFRRLFNPREVIHHVKEMGTAALNLNIHLKTRLEKLLVSNQFGRYEEAPKFFCLETAIHAFNMSWHAYQEGLVPGDIILQHRVRHVLQVEGVQCVISETRTGTSDRRRLVIAFQGTLSMKNVWTDLAFWRRPHDEMVEDWNVYRDKSLWGCMMMLTCRLFDKPLVHSGFSTAWAAMKPQVLEAVSESVSARPVVEPYEAVLVTGHSLGGALAALCAYSITKLPCVIETGVTPEVYTFGMPTVGSAAFGKLFDAFVPTTFRVVNQNDIIHRLSGVLFNQHVGREVCVDVAGNIICAPSFVERILRPTKVGGRRIAAHQMDSYQMALDTIARKFNCPKRCLIEQEQPEEQPEEREEGAAENVK